MKSLDFPIFVLRKDDNKIYVYYKEKELKSTNTKILNTLAYNGINLIDSSGKVYTIKNAYKVKYLGIFGFSFLKKGKQILVDFEFEDNVQNIDLDTFKKNIVNWIKRKQSFLQSAWDIPELIERIQKSNNFEEVAGLMK